MGKTTKRNDKTQSEKYARQSKLTAARQKKYRDGMTDGKKEEYRRKARERYHKRKENQEVKLIKDLSVKEQKEKRKQWKIDSRKYRERIKMEQQAVANTPPDSEVDEVLEDQVSRQAIIGRKKVRRDKAKAYRELKKKTEKIKELNRKLSKYKKRLQREKEKNKSKASPSPAKRVSEIIQKQKVSPAVKKRLFVGFALEKQIKTQLKVLSPKSRESNTIRKSIGTKIIKKYRIQNHLKALLPYTINKHENNATSTDVSYKKNKYSTVKVKDAKLLQNFYEDDTVTKMCPGKKDFVKKGTIKKQRRVLLDSMQNLYKRFVKENGAIVSEATFRRVRPFWVQPPKSRDRETCACIVHTNMELLVTALKRAKVIEHGNLNDLIDSVVCSIYNESCMSGSCDKCKVKSIKYEINEDEEIKFFKWVKTSVIKNIKGVEKKINMTTKKEQVCTPSSTRGYFFNSLKLFKQHTYNLIHQAKVYKTVKKNLKEGVIVFQVDFSQNYVAKYATEIQATHFGASKRQVSLHTGLIYTYDKSLKEVKADTFCTLSDNVDHNAYAIWAHMKPILKETSKAYPNTHTVNLFSDSPSSQYRNRINCYLMKSLLPTYFKNLKYFSWNFSEPGHGKGAMDGVGGSVKRNADFEVKHGKDIKSAADLVNALGSKSKTKLLEIPSADIEYFKHSLPSVIAPIKGIIRIRQVTYGSQGMFGLRLSCFECELGTKCKHYTVTKIDPISSNKTSKNGPGQSSEIKPEKQKKTNNQTNLKLKKILKIGDVWTSSEEDEADLAESGSVCCNEQFTSNDLKLGTFVVVRIDSVLTKQTSRNFVGVVQDDLDNESEIKIMFMKPCGSDMSRFFPNEKDISYVRLDEIVGTLPVPDVVRRGDRIYHQFKKPVKL